MENATEKTEVNAEEQEKIYSDAEVSEIMLTLQKIYALDDAKSCQIGLNRPPTFIQPLEEIRAGLHERMVYLTNKREKDKK